VLGFYIDIRSLKFSLHILRYFYCWYNNHHMEVATKPYHINVGGTIFTTTIDTLSKCNFFLKFFKNEEMKHQTPFIDRDPEGFTHVLRLLRNPEYTIPEEWISELKFYSGIMIPDVTKMDADPTEVYEKDIKTIIYYIDSQEHLEIPLPPSITFILTLTPNYCNLNSETTFLIPHNVDWIHYPLINSETFGFLTAGAQKYEFGNEKVFRPIFIPAIVWYKNTSITIRHDANNRPEKLRVCVSIIIDRSIREKIIRKYQGSVVDSIHNVHYENGYIGRICDDEKLFWMNIPKFLDDMNKSL
jgi:hypothetical protein